MKKLTNPSSSKYHNETPREASRSSHQSATLVSSRWATRRRRLVTALVFAVSLLLAACHANTVTGSGGGSSSTGTPKPTPTLYILFGAGGSLPAADFGYVKGAIESAAQQWNTSARVGIAVYGGPGTACPNINSVSPALDNSATINSTLDGISSSGGWSTAAEGVDAAVSELTTSGLDLARSRIIYVFDGTASACGGGTEQSATVAAVQNAYSNGIDVSVIGAYSSGSTGAFLQQLANAGAGLDPSGTTDAPYDTAATEQGIENDILSFGP